MTEEQKINLKIISVSNPNMNNNNNKINKINNNTNFNEINQVSGMYGITVQELEELMTLYKESHSNFNDIQKLKEIGGTNSILLKLRTDPNKGITTIQNRENDFGSNKIFVEPVPPFCSYVVDALNDFMMMILIAAAIVQILLGATLSDDPSKDWIDGLSIIFAILVVTLVGSITNYQKENKFHELNDIQNQSTKYNVIRNGIPNNLSSDDLLVGDLINIMVGDIMPADLLLIEGNKLKFDESSLTGESETLNKEKYEECLKEIENKKNKPSSPFILSGSNCVEGTGLAVVIAVGEHSQKGIIRRTVDNAQENNQTPLEEKLDEIAKKIGLFGMAAGIITLIALIIRFAVNFVKNTKEYRNDSSEQSLMSTYVQNNPEKMNDKKFHSIVSVSYTNPKKEVGNDILDIILLCVSIIVVAIPEGLPLAVTLSLAFSIKKLMDQNNLVRKMYACETMGGANFICTDKTGTLTKNEMNIYKFLTARNEIILRETLDDENVGNIYNKNRNNNNFDLYHQQKKLREEPSMYFHNNNFWNILRLSFSLNIDGSIKKLDFPNINGDLEECESKNKTDKAFIDFLYRFKNQISKDREIYIPDNESYHQIPFDSKRKRMTTFIKNKNFPTGYRLFTKGGAEKVKSICKFYLDPETGTKFPIGDQQLNFIKDKIESFNRQMLRSLYTCYKDITKEQFENFDKKNSNGLYVDEYDCVFIGCVGIRDSLRNGVKEAVLKCHEAHVCVIMVTGDNIITATAIAKDCNILRNINLENNRPDEIEEDPDLTNDPKKRDEHIKNVLRNKPKAITGNTFYYAIGGLICKTCGEDSNVCKCPKTEAEAKQIAERTGEPQKEIKCDSIKDKNNFITLVQNLRVMARSQPLHKYALVLGLKELDKIVAVTGDGTNDAPALSKSDVGFSMFAGTDIAKEASDIVIMDNNFSSIVVALIYGRNIYDNIRKFLQFQLTVNFCACLLVFICACIGKETPLTTIQMLWINLIMDSLGSLALATEPPYNDLLNREPTRKDESIINGKMWKHIIIQSLFELLLLILLYLYAPKFIKEDDIVRLAENRIIEFCYGQMPGKTSLKNIIYGISTKWSNDINLKHGMNEEDCGNYADKQDLSVAYTEYTNVNGNSAHMTIVFNVFVIYTLFNQINSRIIDDGFNILVRIQNNFFFPLITLSEFALQVVIICFGKEGFKVTERGLTAKHWGICIGFSCLTFILSVIIKLLPIDVKIQEFLDNNKKGNKVSNLEDLLKNEYVNNNSVHKLMDKNDVMISIHRNNYQNVNNFNISSNNNQGNNVININNENNRLNLSNDSKGIKKKNSLSRSGSLRNKKLEFNQSLIQIKT
jgi:Ca2+ transporting ATPase